MYVGCNKGRLLDKMISRGIRKKMRSPAVIAQRDTAIPTNSMLRNKIRQLGNHCEDQCLISANRIAVNIISIVTHEPTTEQF